MYPKMRVFKLNSVTTVDLNVDIREVFEKVFKILKLFKQYLKYFTI